MAELALLTRAGLVVGELGNVRSALKRFPPTSEPPGLMQVDGFDSGGFSMNPNGTLNLFFPMLVEARGAFGHLSGLAPFRPTDYGSHVRRRERWTLCAGCDRFSFKPSGAPFDELCFECLRRDRKLIAEVLEARAQGVLDLAEYDATRGFARAMESLHRLRGDR